jgi:outer membrane protein assembly factor BamB
LFDVDRPQPIHGLNSFASPTPVIVDGKVVCHFGAMGTAGIDAATGEVLWQRKFEINHIVGPGSSPVAYKNLVILTCDGGDQQFVVALDAASGDTVWKQDRPPIRIEDPDLRKAYCTPLLIDVAGREELVIPGAQWFVAYEPATGNEIWRVDHGAGYSNVPRPVFDGKNVFCDTGFNKAQLWAVRADGEGDVTDTNVLWRCTEQMPTMPSPVISDGRIYIVSEGGVASCLEAATGKPVYPKKRIGGQFSASPMLGAGRIYYCSQEGRTTVAAASDTFELLAENDLDGKLMASPAAVDGDLILRTDTHLYRIGEK